MDDSIITRMQRRLKDLESAGIETQFSKDASNWHDSCGSDDVYMRISSNGGTTWGNAVCFRGTGQKGEAGEGVASGGTEDQVLVKHSGMDYDTAWKSLNTSNVPDSADKRYVTDNQRAVLSNTSSINTGDETAASIKTKLGITALSGTNTGDQTLEALGGIPISLKGNANGVAELDTNGHVPQAQLPSYVDDVLEYANLASFPATGESGKIYVADDTNLAYRWSGSAYVVISPTLALGETMSTAYRGDRGKTAYDHSQSTGNPHNSRLASSDFAGQGTAETVLHGNASGNPAFGPVAENDLSLTDNTTADASTSAHGFAPKAAEPSAGNLNVIGIENGETAYSNKTILDTTTPSAQAVGDPASAGNSAKAARADHKHAMPLFEASASNIEMDGAASAGTLTTIPRADHVHPTDTSRVPLTRKINGHELTDDITLIASDIDLSNIGTLGADNATIANLQSGSTQIDELNITDQVDAVKGIFGSAEVTNLSATKIIGGTIDAAEVTSAVLNGSLKVGGDLIQIFQGTGETQLERIAIGDVNGNGTVYGLRVRGENGKTELYNEEGLTNEGLSYVWSKTGDDVEGFLSKGPLNIDSLILSINGAATNIVSSKVQMENGTLNVEFSNLKNKILSQSNQIQQNTAAIDTKVSIEKYESDKGELDLQINGIEKSIDDINFSITQLQSGSNLILNSSGLKDCEFWNKTGTVETENDNSYKTVSGRYFNLSAGAALSQNVHVTAGKMFSISLKASKESASHGYVTVTDGVNTYTVFDDSASTSDGSSYSKTFTPENNFITINIGATGDGLLIADIMLAQNGQPQAWSPAPEEIYTGDVKIDSDGIGVSGESGGIETNISGNGFEVKHKGTTAISVNEDRTKLENMQIGNIMFVPSGSYVNVVYLS